MNIKKIHYILGFGLMLTTVIIYGLKNHFNDIIIPKEYKILIGEIKL
jgi:hypothetical protein